MTVQYNQADSITIGTTNALIITGNINTVRFVITNNDDTQILWISKGGTAISGKGIPILPKGSYQEPDVGVKIWKGDISGVMDGGAGSSISFERVIEVD